MKTKRFLTLFAAILSLSFTSVFALETGDAAPNFSLPGTDGKEHSLSDYKGKYVVLEWLNHNCPFVKKHYNSGNMQQLQEHYTEAGVVWLSINSTNPDHRDYVSLEQEAQLAISEHAHATAILHDSDGSVGHAYEAQTTPHIFIIDPDGNVVYQGAIDSIRSANPADISQATNYIKTALDALMSGQTVALPSTKSYGCGVKYR